MEMGWAGMPRSRRSDPDYIVDPDRGSSAEQTSKQAELLTSGGYQERDEQRAGARELDVAVESMPGLTRQQRDRERAMPRGVSGEVPYPQMQRSLPAAGDVRKPISSRQRKARSITKRAVQDRLTRTQYIALTDTVSGDGRTWQRLNDDLSEHTGDVQEVEERDKATIQRIDRAIQAYERAGNRGHIVYSNMELPRWINASNLDGFVRNNFKPGREVAFDRFTLGAHNLHQVDVEADRERRSAVFEIQTRRGMYLGRSDSIDDTAHLLPRGLQLRVDGVHRAKYQRPDGTSGSRLVIQLIDNTSEEQQ
jgi:hypothetical protein